MKPVLYFLALMPAALHAETFTIDTDVSAVNLFPQGAQITRSAAFDVPAGTHRLVLLGVPAQAVRDRADDARLKADAARHSLTFLSNLGHNEGLAGSDADALRSIARMIGDESLAAGRTAQTAEVEAREIETRLTDLETELEVAQANLARGDDTGLIPGSAGLG